MIRCVSVRGVGVRRRRAGISEKRVKYVYIVHQYKIGPDEYPNYALDSSDTTYTYVKYVKYVNAKTINNIEYRTQIPTSLILHELRQVTGALYTHRNKSN